MSLKSTDSLYLGYIQIANFNFGVDILKKHKPNKRHELGIHMDEKPVVKLCDISTVPAHRALPKLWVCCPWGSSREKSEMMQSSYFYCAVLSGWEWRATPAKPVLNGQNSILIGITARIQMSSHFVFQITKIPTPDSVKQPNELPFSVDKQAMKTPRGDMSHKLRGTISANEYTQSLHKGLDQAGIALGGAASLGYQRDRSETEKAK